MIKLPNGYGGVHPLSGKRRRPFIVQITVGWTEDKKQIRETIGYAKNRAEGLEMLVDYHKNPYNLDYKKITFSEVWKDVDKMLYHLVEINKMSQSNYDGYVNAYNSHCKSLYDMPILKIRYLQLEHVLNSAVGVTTNKPLGTTGRKYIKLVCQKIFDYAEKYYELPLEKNPADLLEVEQATRSSKHKPFTQEEKNIMWKMTDNDIIKILLIFCYTGTRPNELFKTHKSKIFLTKNYFVTGSKTASGKDREIPIHPKIKHLIKYFYNQDVEYPFMTVLENFTYDKFKKHCRKLMKELNFDHTPYDGRHTFITDMKNANANVFILKLIVGHKIQDVTEAVYTHRDIKDLLNEIKKIS